jgi:hypothetical protein
VERLEEQQERVRELWPPEARAAPPEQPAERREGERPAVWPVWSLPVPELVPEPEPAASPPLQQQALEREQEQRSARAALPPRQGQEPERVLVQAVWGRLPVQAPEPA